jgi:hypothetical protein
MSGILGLAVQVREWLDELTPWEDMNIKEMAVCLSLSRVECTRCGNQAARRTFLCRQRSWSGGGFSWLAALFECPTGLKPSLAHAKTASRGMLATMRGEVGTAGR